MNKKYKKTYTREDTLMMLEIGEKQYEILKNKLRADEYIPPTLFDSNDGLISIYLHDDVLFIWTNLISLKIKNDPHFISATIAWFEHTMYQLEPFFKTQVAENLEELEKFYTIATDAWAGLTIFFIAPSIPILSDNDKKMILSLREKNRSFVENTNHVFQKTLSKLYPNLGELLKFVQFDEIQKGKIPTEEDLKKRKDHFIYYNLKLYTDIDFSAFILKENIQLETEAVSANITEIKGVSSMKGKVTGRVRVLRKKAEISLLKDEEILVSTMTTPDYLPAMKKAAAIITDEGGIMSHAAIIARELRKPCITGTKIATTILKDGDFVEVDADNGVIKIIK